MRGELLADLRPVPDDRRGALRNYRDVGAATDLLTSLQADGDLVDLHCHVLPDLDDGAVNLTESIAMATQAWSDGIGTICSTPHLRDDHDVRASELPGRVGALNQSLRDLGIPVEIAEGAELSAARADHLSDVELREVSLGTSSHWILLEPSPGPIGQEFCDLVDRLHDRDVRCIVAHPERHAAADIGDWLGRLVDRGALVQVTAAFLTGGHGAGPVILDWAAQGLVHLVGSDSHSATVGRPATVSAGLRALATVPRLADHVDWIARDAPRAILAGDDFTVPF